MLRMVIWFYLSKVKTPWAVYTAEPQGKNYNTKHVEHQTVAPDNKSKGGNPKSECIDLTVLGLAPLDITAIDECVTVNAPADFWHENDGPAAVNNDLEHCWVPAFLPDL